MEEKEIQQRLHLLHQEVEAAIALVEEVKLTCTTATAALKIEMEVLRRFLEQDHPEFAHRIAELRTQVLHEVNPEELVPGKTGG